MSFDSFRPIQFYLDNGIIPMKDPVRTILDNVNEISANVAEKLEAATDNAPSSTCVRIDGVRYPLGKFGLREMSSLAEWANGRLPSPYESLKPMLEGASPEEARELRMLAYQEARLGPKAFGDPAVLALAQSADGIREVFYLSLRKADPSVDRAMADDLADRLGIEEAGQVLAAAFRND